jgi:Asp-tRNA(Asn)/Glu-tRNA(Gln) amidotransferase A subunit family amidase
MMIENELTGLTAVEAARRIATGKMSAETYVGACLENITALDDQVHAFVHLDPKDALRQARALDEHKSKGAPLGPLHGVPIAIKDIFDTADYPTECGSPILKGRRPMHDCTAVARLREAGAVIIGKTVTTEFAYLHPGATRNPHDPERTPGGSSSGSAAAVAAGMVPLAIGSQTNGSMIRPASYCGVYGCKPTHGAISRYGALTLSQALDHVGMFARSVADIALLLEVLAGYDPKDSDTRAIAAPAFLDVMADELPLSPRFAFVRSPIWEKADVEARAAFEEFVANLGGRAQAVDLPSEYAAAWDDQRVIMAVEMAHNLSDIVAHGGESMSSVTLRDFLAEGGGMSALRYLTARANAGRYAAGIAEIFKEYDAIITPATPGIAPKGEATGSPIFCSLWTLTGFPALSLPLLKGTCGMPIGVQLIGERGDDARLLRTANRLVREIGR